VIIGIVGAAIMLAVVLELVRRRRLRIGYSLLWLLIGSTALTLILFRGILGTLAQIIGVESPVSLLFTAGIVFSFLILLEHSLTLTILWRQNKNLAQNQALLEWRIRQLETRLDAQPGFRSEPVLERPQREGLDGLPYWAQLGLPAEAIASWQEDTEYVWKAESLPVSRAPMRYSEQSLKEISSD
jgi:hypothetical protein